MCCAVILIPGYPGLLCCFVHNLPLPAPACRTCTAPQHFPCHPPRSQGLNSMLFAPLHRHMLSTSAHFLTSQSAAQSMADLFVLRTARLAVKERLPLTAGQCTSALPLPPPTPTHPVYRGLTQPCTKHGRPIRVAHCTPGHGGGAAGFNKAPKSATAQRHRFPSPPQSTNLPPALDELGRTAPGTNGPCYSLQYHDPLPPLDAS